MLCMPHDSRYTLPYRMLCMPRHTRPHTGSSVEPWLTAHAFALGHASRTQRQQTRFIATETERQTCSKSIPTPVLNLSFQAYDGTGAAGLRDRGVILFLATATL